MRVREIHRRGANGLRRMPLKASTQIEIMKRHDGRFTMKVHLGFAAMVLVLLLAGTGAAQGQPQGKITVRDGYWWTNQAQDFKSGFVTGFAMAMSGNSDAAVLRCLATKQGDAEKASGEDWKECTQKPEVQMLSYGNLRIGQSVEEVAEFYKYFRNKNLVVDVANALRQR
jgi:hypothetical protein